MKITKHKVGVMKITKHKVFIVDSSIRRNPRAGSTVTFTPINKSIRVEGIIDVKCIKSLLSAPKDRSPIFRLNENIGGFTCLSLTEFHRFREEGVVKFKGILTASEHAFGAFIGTIQEIVTTQEFEEFYHEPLPEWFYIYSENPSSCKDCDNDDISCDKCSLVEFETIEEALKRTGKGGEI